MPRKTACGATPITRRSITDTLQLDMGTIVPAISGPKRPQDYVALTSATAFANTSRACAALGSRQKRRWDGEGGQPDRDIPGDAGHHNRGRSRARITTTARRLDRDRLDHLLHQHLEPLCDDRRRSGGAQGARTGPDPQALGENLAGTRLAGRVRISGSGRSAGRPGRHRLQPCRLWLHHLHRQLGPAAARDLAKRSTTTT